MELFITEKELDRALKEHGLSAADVCAEASRLGVTDVVFIGDNSFFGLDGLKRAADACGLRTACGIGITAAGSGTVSVFPKNDAGRGLLLEFLHASREAGETDIAFVKGVLGGSLDITATTGWDDGPLRNILLSNGALEARAAALQKAVEEGSADERAYEEASLRKKELEAELKELTEYEDYERRVSGATWKDLETGLDGMRQAREEMERFVEGNRDRIAAVKKELSGVGRVMKASAKGHDAAVKARKQRDLCRKKIKPAETVVKETVKALRGLKGIFPGLYAEVREGDPASEVLGCIAGSEGVPLISCAFLKDGAIEVPRRETNGSAVLGEEGERALRDAEIVLGSGGVALRDGRIAISRASLEAAEKAAKEAYGGMACTARAEDGSFVLLTSAEGEPWRYAPLSEKEGETLLEGRVEAGGGALSVTELCFSRLLEAAEAAGGSRTEGSGKPKIRELLAGASGETDPEVLRIAEGALEEDPGAFLCALFNAAEPGGYGPAADLCREKGVALLPPDINLSGYGFSLSAEGGSPALRTGLKAVAARSGRHLGLLEGISGYREALGGSFGSLEQFLSATIRVTAGAEKPYSCLPPELLSDLALSGAFDRFGCGRAAAAAALSKPMEGTRRAYCVDAVKRLRIERGRTSEAERRRMEAGVLGYFTEALPLPPEEGVLAGTLAEVKRLGGELALKIVNGSGTHRAVLRGSAEKKYADTAFSLLYEDVRAEGQEGEGGFVIETLAEKPAGSRNELIAHATTEDIAFIKSLGAEAVKDPEGVRVAVMEWECPDGRVKRGPVFYHFTPEALRRCREHGVRFADPDRPAFPENEKTEARSA